jgi:hypothetical protein
MSNSIKGPIAGLGCILAIIAINVTIGTWSVIYLLDALGKHIGIGWAMLVALFVSEITVPVAIVVWLLKLAGVL